MAQYKCKIAAVTNRGKCRKVNQDSILALQRKIGNSEYVLIAVADGMGGLECGEHASRMMMSMLTDWWDTCLAPMVAADVNFVQMGNSLTDVIGRVHVTLQSEASNIGKSGTTVSMMFICDDRYLTCHAGDSRIYRSCDNMLFQVTTDDTWVYHAFISGQIRSDEMATHEYRHALVNAVGIGEQLSVQQSEGIMEMGERYLICSDGLYNEVSLDEMGKILNTCLDTQQKAESLMAKALSETAGDNISAVLVELQ